MVTILFGALLDAVGAVGLVEATGDIDGLGAAVFAGSAAGVAEGLG